MSKPLEKEFKYYIDHQNELINKYRGKFIVIKGCTVIGAYDSDLEAIEETSRKEESGTFLVQECEVEKDNYTPMYNSRVALI